MKTWMGNKGDVAEFFDVSTTTMDEWIRRGCPFLTRGGANAKWAFDLRAVYQWHSARHRHKSAKASPTTDAAQRKALADAELKELELAERKSQVANIEQVTHDMGRVFKNLSTRLQAIPIKAAPHMVACRTEAQCQAVLAKLMDEALHELSHLPFLDESVSTGGATVGSPAAAHGEPVGRSTSDAQSGKQRGAGTVGHRKSRVPARHS